MSGFVAYGRSPHPLKKRGFGMTSGQCSGVEFRGGLPRFLRMADLELKSVWINFAMKKAGGEPGWSHIIEVCWGRLGAAEYSAASADDSATWRIGR